MNAPVVNTANMEEPGSKALFPPGPEAPWPIRWLGRLVDLAVVLIGATMASLILLNVVVHNVFHGDIAWTTELSELLMVWVTFLGGAAATRRGGHMTIAELLDHLGPGGRRYVEAAIQLIVLCTLGLLTWYGAGIAQAGMLSVLTVLQIPMATQYAALPVASAITMVFVAWDLFAILRGDSKVQRYGASET